MRDFDEVALCESELTLHAAQLLELLDRRRARPASGYALALQLGRLVGAWRRMVVVRERDLYRPLLADLNSLRGGIAIACAARMEGLGAALEGCVQRWPSSALIEADRRRFAAELVALLALTRAHFDCDRSLLLGPEAEEARAAA